MQQSASLGSHRRERMGIPPTGNDKTAYINHMDGKLLMVPILLPIFRGRIGANDGGRQLVTPRLCRCQKRLFGFLQTAVPSAQGRAVGGDNERLAFLLLVRSAYCLIVPFRAPVARFLFDLLSSLSRPRKEPRVD